MHPYLSNLTQYFSNHLFRKNLTKEDIESLQEYYAFEVKLEEQKKETDIASLRTQITQEIVRYQQTALVNSALSVPAVREEIDADQLNDSDYETEFTCMYPIEYGSDSEDSDDLLLASNSQRKTRFHSLGTILSRLQLSPVDQQNDPSTVVQDVSLVGEPTSMPEQQAYYYLDSDESESEMIDEQEQKKPITVHEPSPSSPMSSTSSPSSTGHSFFDRTVYSAQRNEDGNTTMEIDTNTFIQRHFQ